MKRLTSMEAISELTKSKQNRTKNIITIIASQHGKASESLT